MRERARKPGAELRVTAEEPGTAVCVSIALS
jgi:signal transduction histidine kinase